MQEHAKVESDLLEYFGDVVDVKVDAPPCLKSQNFMSYQTVEHFETMAQKKIDRQHMEPLCRTVLVKFGFLKDGLGFHLGMEKFRFKQDRDEYPESILLAVQGDTLISSVLPN